ncbi:MAG: uroporphyrinogen-III synthase [Hyphomicrobiales bacterium]|nr:uroporphyrinogen-III synthase [Hyphomicrobiales bacterium]
MTAGPFIVTRPAGDAGSLMAALDAAGLETIAAPLLSIEYRPDARLPDVAVQAILMTSANSCRALTQLAGAAKLQDTLTIAVGEASAEAARDGGQTHVVTAGGDVDALIETASRHCTPAGGPLLYISGAQTTGRLHERLTERGFEVHRVVAYEAVAALELPDIVKTAIGGQNAAGVILYSPRTAIIWCSLLNQLKLAEQGPNLAYYCLSVNVADVIRDAFGASSAIVIAAEPTERAMIAAITDAART